MRAGVEGNGLADSGAATCGRADAGGASCGRADIGAIAVGVLSKRTVRADDTALRLGPRCGVGVGPPAVSVAPYIGVRAVGSADGGLRSSERDRRRSALSVAVDGVVVLFRRTRSAHSRLASASEGVTAEPAGRAERSAARGEGVRVFKLKGGRAESGIGAGRDLGGTGRGLGGGAGLSISSVSGVRDMYIETRESLADVWRDSFPVSVGASRTADFLGGSGVLRLIETNGVSLGEGSDGRVGCLMSGERVSRRGAGRPTVGEGPRRRGEEGKDGFLKTGSGAESIAFSSATGVMGRATSTTGLD